MSERTTIGGTVYEAIGSSSSNLLLKCNGTARIQWGNKLIDLIKNGKIASESSLELIFIISDESEIKSDGVYLLTTEESSLLWINKDGNKYNLTGTDLYISASKPLKLTVEQKKQALDNIGMYYNTLSDVQSSGVKNGIVYVLDTKTLYTIKDGVIEEFEAKLKTVTVDKETVEGEIINSSVKIVLSILDLEYLILADLRITANYSIHVKNSAQLGSEGADKTQGYRLYIDGSTSYLDVDEINVRHGLKVKQYKEVLFEDLNTLLKLEQLEPHQWYLITDFLNHWKLPVQDIKFNRPILVRALTNKTLYEKGFLFKDQRVQINYDAFYQEPITQVQVVDGITSEANVTARGRITWMKDGHNNEANFDFLDYTDTEGNELTTLHLPDDTDETLDKSIFPKYSYNNKLITYDLKGITLKNQVLDNSNTTIIDFLFNDLEEASMVMHDNTIKCRGLILTPTCTDFYNNILELVIKLEISNKFINNYLYSIITTLDGTIVNNFDLITDNNNYSSIIISNPVEKATLKNLYNTTINATLNNVEFYGLNTCILDSGNIENVISYNAINQINFNSIDYPLLYIAEKKKSIDVLSIQGNAVIKISCIPESIFYRGMIIMHSGIETVPDGWAICDGGIYEWNGIQSQTPDLRNRFIKATESLNSSEVKASDPNNDLDVNGKLVLRSDLLPLHSHPHQQHSHTFSENGYMESSTSFYALTGASSVNAITSVEGGSSGYSGDSTSGETINVNVSGNVYISGTTSSEYSYEDTTTVFENNPINIEPNYYSLIFIMKL